MKSKLERINSARSKFFEYYEEGSDEWAETFAAGVDFARRLCDTTDDALCLAVINWLENCADTAAEAGDEGGTSDE